MSKIVIIGAGAMGSAFALPCIDNKHDVCIIGTHLENDFIDNLNANGKLHPGLKIELDNNSYYYNTGDLINHYSFLHFKDDSLELKYFKN